ncbi:ATP-binding region, ATPase-like protein [Acidovorax delafieldii 2AN]|uniref:ATP-binding region, ATPase-like protein n=1 Tax=Acidovorax delafieldii 2AN TaxID=573060 RepID=C5T013_ACIDE|nr:ATP-binding protein [Acidovorax delafieldii]EER62121.1 ATP-binding region, ATPase-like protein [Acidovorax delafieldii 2AN]
MKIQVRINEEGVLRNQRFAFTDRFTLVTELLQNARRAGARHIAVDHLAEERVLRIRDDGRGIEDFQKLLSFHESGWDDGMVAQEHPFGIGFTKCLYAVDRIVVASGRQRADIDTAAALRRETFEVLDSEQAETGTLIELHGADVDGLEQRIETLCQGFPVDVVFNGKTLERRYAEDHLPLTSTPIGAVHVSGNHSGKATRQTLIFLQGFCVHRPMYFNAGEANVVHLDPRQFMARLPDRDMLIDADQQLKRVETQLKQSWRAILVVAKSQLEARQFVSTYFEAMRQWGHLDLLNDMDELPAALFESITGYPVQTVYGQRDYVETVAEPPTRQDIESGRVTLVSLGWPTSENAGHWMLARSKQWLVALAYQLDRDHWIHPHVRYIELQSAEIEAQAEAARTKLEGRWVWPLVILCDTVRVRVGDHEAIIADEAVCQEDVILVPAGETSGEAVRQLSDFRDEHDHVRDDDMEADCNVLADLIRRLRSTDPVSTLSSLLSELTLGRYPLLHGRRFEITVGTGSSPGCLVELSASGDGHAER